MPEAREEIQIRDEEGALLADYVRSVEAALEADAKPEIRALAGDLRDADLADLIELLKAEQRGPLIEALGKDFNPAALSELEEPVRDQVLDAMPNAQVAKAVRELESDDAVYLLEDMEEADQSEILAKLPKEERIALERSLEYPEDSAGRLMQTEVITVPPFWSVGQVIDYMREDEDLPSAFTQVWVVDPTHHLVGRVPLDRLLRTKRPVPISDITDTDLHQITVESDQEEVALQFERYDLMSAPVVDGDNRLVGVVTVDDIVEVVREEAEEDIHRLGGVGDESITDTVLRTTRSRFTWLLVNLATAVLASWVISLFDATIDQMVALAVLMPIVASMGGNAGTQTMTVAVRALATRDLGAVNAFRVITREVVVGALNGLLFAGIMGVVAYYWFGSDQLGFVIAAAMVINMLVAALSGILVPLGLDAMDIDPAIASSVFVTTVTDVVGFFAFLGLAAVWLF
ncbi:MAG: magnesium transporter [Hyphomicrobiales bacterium]|nr:magnesium transporter [Hyphomicrobiales bacterium]